MIRTIVFCALVFVLAAANAFIIKILSLRAFRRLLWKAVMIIKKWRMVIL